MTLLEQLERELVRVRAELHRLTRDHAVLAEQITRLRTGAPEEVVCGALQVAFGVRLDLYLLAGQGSNADQPVASADQVPARSQEGNGRGLSPGLFTFQNGKVA